MHPRPVLLRQYLHHGWNADALERASNGLGYAGLVHDEPRHDHAPVAQRKEHEASTLSVAGSNPAGRSIRFYDGFVEPKSEVWRRA